MCERLLKNAYNELPDQEEKDEFVREHVARARKLKCGKSHYIFGYLLEFAFENKDLNRAVAESCVNDMCCSTCMTMKSSVYGRVSDLKDKLIYSLIFGELLSIAQEKGPISVCFSGFDIDKENDRILNGAVKIRDMKALDILNGLKTKANDLHPGLYEKLNLDYSKYRSDFPPVSKIDAKAEEESSRGGKKEEGKKGN